MQTNSGITGVLFDLDGTLLDTAPDMVASLEPICSRLKLPMPLYDEARNHVSRGAAGLLRMAFPHFNEEEITALVPEYLDVYASRLAVDTVLFDGMETLLKEFEDNDILWGVVTNKPAFLTDPLLKALDLFDRSACVVSGDTLPQRKPAPEPLLHGLSQAGLNAVNCFYVGDAERDIAAGRAAGMYTVAAAFGYIPPEENPSDWQADHLIHSPAEIRGLLAHY